MTEKKRNQNTWNEKGKNERPSSACYISHTLLIGLCRIIVGYWWWCPIMKRNKSAAWKRWMKALVNVSAECNGWRSDEEQRWMKALSCEKQANSKKVGQPIMGKRASFFWPSWLRSQLVRSRLTLLDDRRWWPELTHSYHHSSNLSSSFVGRHK